jgi:predicted nucleic acid-binding protein
VTDAWVVNASPIILYSRIERLDLIERLAPAVIVPQTVIEEVKAGLPKDKFASDAVAWASRFLRPNVAVPDRVMRWDLGPGESQVISHCLAGARVALLDDLLGRHCATSEGIQVIGSLGVVLRARQKGLIDEGRSLAYRLRDQGLFVDAELLERALSEPGEGA